MADKPVHGRIIWANFVDPQGNEAGPHRAVIITPTEDIEAGKPIRVVVISSKLHWAKAEDMVILPFFPTSAGHPVTRLKKKSAAICNWRPAIKEADITGYGGEIKGKWLFSILKRVKELDKETEPNSPSTQS